MSDVPFHRLPEPSGQTRASVHWGFCTRIATFVNVCVSVVCPETKGSNLMCLIRLWDLGNSLCIPYVFFSSVSYNFLMSLLQPVQRGSHTATNFKQSQPEHSIWSDLLYFVFSIDWSNSRIVRNASAAFTLASRISFDFETHDWHILQERSCEKLTQVNAS